MTAPDMSESASPSSASVPATPVNGADIASMDDSKKLSRLKFLVEKSKVYASILTEQLEKKEREEEKKEERAASTERRRSGRLKEQQKAPPPPPPSKKAGTKKKGQKSIFDFSKKKKGELFGKGEISSTKEALQRNDAVEDSYKSDVIPSVGQPKLVTGGKMHEHQISGMEWLISLYENGLNGILADEMGLGKTLQTIAFLAYLIEHGVHGPFLIVGPLSTVENWINEVKRFTPTINTIKYHGTQQERAQLRKKYFSSKKQRENYPIVVTSYEMIVKDTKYLLNYGWKYVIVDEGHRIKNMNCKLIKELKRLDTANRLLLTGTPLQNKLAELWSLLNFLLPDVFTDLSLFQEWFDDIGDTSSLSSNSELVASLHSILRPFLLRRLKTDVEYELPPKREYVIYGDLTDDQVQLYQSFLHKEPKEYIINKILEARGSNKRINNSRHSTEKSAKRRRTELSYVEMDDDEFFESLEKQDNERPSSEELLSEDDDTLAMIKTAQQEVRAKGLQNMIMQLRLTCNSPYLFYYPWTVNDKIDERIVNTSGKMLLLDKLCQRLIKNNHKILIFSQFTKMLDVLEDWVGELRGWKYGRIDGSSSQMARQESIDNFNNDTKTKVFLLSTRAGGLGINLSAADTVIIFDSDWNPQQDLQAIDRAHRIGQTKPVLVFRLATGNTVEQRLLERAGSKRQLEKTVIEKGRFKGLLFNNASTEQEAIDEISDELQKARTTTEGGSITEKDLKTILDRSQNAYDNAKLTAKGLSKNITLV